MNNSPRPCIRGVAGLTGRNGSERSYMQRLLMMGVLLLLPGCASIDERNAPTVTRPLPDGFTGVFSPQGVYLGGDSYHRSMPWPIDVFVALGDYNRLAPARKLRVARHGGMLEFQIVDAQEQVLLTTTREVQIEGMDGLEFPVIHEKITAGNEWEHRWTTRIVSFQLTQDGSLRLSLRETGTSTGLLFVPLPYSDTRVVIFKRLP